MFDEKKYDLLHEINSATNGNLDSLVLDGQYHRFNTGKDLDGWYIGDETVDGYWKCTYGCKRQDIKFTAYSHKGISKSQRDYFSRSYFKAAEEHQQERLKKRQEATETARDIWDKSDSDTSFSEYLKKKQVGSYGIRWNPIYQNLVIPIFNVSGELVSLQFIRNDGTKIFLKNGAKAGGFFIIGNPELSDVFYIAEGYATAATIYECTGITVVVTFDAGNLSAVARIFREKYPDHEIIIAADNDRFTSGNPGLTKAKTAAIESKAILAIPEFKVPYGTDYNDLCLQEGSEVVSASFAKASEPELPEPPKPEPPAPEPVPEFDFAGSYKDSYKKLQEFTNSQHKIPAAKAFLKRYFGMVPVKFELEELVAGIAYTLDLNEQEKREIEGCARWFYGMVKDAHIKELELTLEPDYTELAKGIEAFINLYHIDPEQKWNVFISAPQGAGKNQVAIKRALTNILKKSLIVNHRQSLCRDTAGSLGVQSYQDENIDGTGNLVCCVNSLPSSELEPCTHGSQVIFWDEETQVMREVLNRKGTVATGNFGIKKTLDKIAELANKAKINFLLDADLNDDAVKVFQDLVPNRKTFVIKVPFKKQNKTVYYGTKQQLLEELRHYADKDLNIWIGTNNATLAKQIEQELIELNPTLVTAKDPFATTGNDTVIELLNNVNGNIHKHRIVIATSVIGTGVSITKQHFDKHFFFYSGDTVTPSDFNQMMLRDRTWKECYLGIDQKYSSIEDVESLIERQKAAAEFEAEVLGKESTFDAQDELTRLCNERDAKESRMMVNPGQALLMILEHRGYTIQKLHSKDLSGQEIKRLRQMVKEEYIELIKSAGVVTDDDYKQIQRKARRTTEESAKLEAYAMHQCFNLSPWLPLEDEHFELWNFGKLAQQKKNFQRLISDKDEDKPLQKAFHKLLDRAGIDFDSGEGTVTKESALEAYKLMKKCNGGSYLEEEGFLIFRKGKDSSPKYPIRWVSDFLDHFGLTLEGKQERISVTDEGVNFKENIAPSVTPKTSSKPAPDGRRDRFYSLKISRKIFVWDLASGKTFYCTTTELSTDAESSKPSDDVVVNNNNNTVFYTKPSKPDNYGNIMVSNQFQRKVMPKKQLLGTPIRTIQELLPSFGDMPLSELIHKARDYMEDDVVLDTLERMVKQKIVFYDCENKIVELAY